MRVKAIAFVLILGLGVLLFVAMRSGSRADAANGNPTAPCCAVTSGEPCGGLLSASPADNAIICALHARSR